MDFRIFLLLSFLILPLQRLFADARKAAYQVIERRVPELCNRLQFELIPEAAGGDVYETESHEGRLVVRGNSSVALCRGTYDFLKEHCNCLVTWEGSQLQLPASLPDTPLRRVEGSVPLRQHFNVVTFGYSTAFWDWKRWEFEIDWMALHGINMPLAMTGQESIWKKVWTQHFGLSEADLDDFFTGPAFLPWHRMGNIYSNKDEVLHMLGADRNGHSLPQSFIDADAQMQRRILRRELELGMKPVVPAFSGFIPRALKAKYPELQTTEPTKWNSACSPSLLLSAKDPKFRQIFDAFFKEYEKFYGKVTDYYLIDLFNEIDPPADVTRQDLAEISKRVYATLLANNPDAVWVIQGWCFYYQNYWRDLENTKAYLSGVPDDRMIVIDLNADRSEVFRLHPEAVAGKQVVWSLLNDNWGQRTPLHGNLDRIAQSPHKALKDLGDHLVGMGNSSEGIECNSVCFELLYDNPWRTEAFDLSQWLRDYASQRYATRPEIAAEIWSGIYRLYYRNNSDDVCPRYLNTPAKNQAVDCGECVEERDLLEKMLSAPEEIRRQPLFKRDLVDVMKSYTGKQLSTAAWKVVNAIEAGDPKAAEYRADFNQMMTALDELLHTQPQHRLARWISNARSYAGRRDRGYMEKNARLQVTTWVSPYWQGYARKEWSGLVGDFHRRRWNLFFDSLSSPKFDQEVFNKEVFDWSNRWCESTVLPNVREVQPVEASSEILRIVDRMRSTIGLVPRAANGGQTGNKQKYKRLEGRED